MGKAIVLFILIIMFAFFLTGCTQQQPQQTATPTPVPAPTTAPTPKEEIPAAEIQEAPQPPAATLGEGDQAISEEEIPAYDTSADKELESLIKEVEG